MSIKVKGSAGKGLGLFLVSGEVKRGHVVAHMTKPRKIAAEKWKLKKLPEKDKERIRMWGKQLPDDVGIHQGRYVWYDQAMRGARLKHARKPGRPLEWKGYPIIIYDNTLKGRVPRWYRLNHATPANTKMVLKKIDGKTTIAWVASKHLKVRRGEPIELTFSYGEVPRCGR